MIYNSEELKEYEFKSLEAKFYTLLTRLEIYEDETKTINLSEQLRQIVDEWHSSYGLENLEEYIINEDQLEDTILKYPEIENEYHHIIDAYRFKKRVTTIELNSIPVQRVFEILRSLEPFFFVAHVHLRRKSEDIIIMSRFRHSLEVAKKYIRKYKGSFFKFADLIGSLTGYNSVEIAPYCLQSRLKKYNLIK